MARPNWISLDEEPEDEGWMTTYADAITLLMAFFVLLASFSKVDIPLYEKVMAGIQNEMGKKEFESPTKILKLDVEDVVASMGADQVVNVGTDSQGVMIELSSSAFYKPGSANIRDEANPVLEKMAQTLMAPRYRTFVIEIEGHTDDDPIHTAVYPSNWELSAGRATEVVRFLIRQGLEADRLKASGYAETRPKVPNRDDRGVPIPENQAQNRRVIIRVHPMDLAERMDTLRKLDIEKFSESAEPAKSAEPTVTR